MDAVGGGDEVRELRAQLKVSFSLSLSAYAQQHLDDVQCNARNDVTRYASRMRRLELQLAKERGEAATAAAATKSTGESQASDTDLRVEEAVNAAEAWTKVLKAVEQRLQQCSCQGGGHTTELSGLHRFIQQQQQMAIELGHENAKLRDQLHARPTRSQLVTAQLEIEHFRSQLRNGFRSKQGMKSQQHENERGAAVAGDATSATPAEAAEKRPDTTPLALEPLPSDTLSEGISLDKLLSWLRVETKPQAKSTQRAFLKDLSVQCYLTLDQAALAAHATPAAISGKENVSVNMRNRERQQQKQKDALERKVGRLCSEIVASCCHVLQVKHVRELPRAAQAASRLATIVPTFQRFLSKLQAVLHRLQEGKSKFVMPRASSLPPYEDLESLLERAEDVVVELEARRKHMNQASGASAFDALFELMTLLQAPQADQLQPIVLRLIESSRTEKLFMLQLRELLGLKPSSTRDDIVKIITKLLQQLKIVSKLQQTKDARVKTQQ